ncbi:hypothetical protein ACFPOE_21595 [Caenimonas terrae]|uniref:Serine protease n=1 Tax=Caenimonas terrae TaxID=696074 RepID=A0ABW0NIA5_9BURK
MNFALQAANGKVHDMSKNSPPHSEMDKLSSDLAGQISNAPKHFAGWYVPVFKTDPQDAPYHYGTAFGVEINDTPYLVTAAHVLAKDPNNVSDGSGVGLVFCEGQLRELSPYDQIRLTIPADGSTVDVVAVRPRSLDLRKVFSGFFKVEHVFRDNLRPNMYLAACGFPETKNRRATWAQTLAQRPYAYFGLASDDSMRVALGFNGAHFCLDFDVRWTFRNGFGGFKAPAPHGISGGPVLVVHDFGDPLRVLSPRLIGVGIETRQKMKCFVCVDLRYLLTELSRLPS